MVAVPRLEHRTSLDVPLADELPNVEHRIVAVLQSVVDRHRTADCSTKSKSAD